MGRLAPCATCRHGSTGARHVPAAWRRRRPMVAYGRKTCSDVKSPLFVATHGEGGGLWWGPPRLSRRLQWGLVWTQAAVDSGKRRQQPIRPVGGQSADPSRRRTRVQAPRDEAAGSLCDAWRRRPTVATSPYPRALQWPHGRRWIERCCVATTMATAATAIAVGNELRLHWERRRRQQQRGGSRQGGGQGLD